MSTPFLTKYNKRLVGAELFKTETRTIPSSPYTIKLEEIPLLDILHSKDVSIPGYTRVLISPDANQFYVNFNRGILTFNSGNTGVIVDISYWGMGTLADADDINLIQTSINTLESKTQVAIFVSDPAVTISDVGTIFYNSTENQFKGVINDGTGHPAIIILG